VVESTFAKTALPGAPRPPLHAPPVVSSNHVDASGWRGSRARTWSSCRTSGKHLAASRATREDTPLRASHHIGCSQLRKVAPTPLMDRTWKRRGVDQTRLGHSSIPRPPQQRRRWESSGIRPRSVSMVGGARGHQNATGHPSQRREQRSLGRRREPGVEAVLSTHPLSHRPGSPTVQWCSPSDWWHGFARFRCILTPLRLDS
jgi:hypothetical protein